MAEKKKNSLSVKIQHSERLQTNECYIQPRSRPTESNNLSRLRGIIILLSGVCGCKSTTKILINQMKSELFAKILDIVAEATELSTDAIHLKARQKNVSQHVHCLCIFAVLKAYPRALFGTISAEREMTALPTPIPPIMLSTSPRCTSVTLPMPLNASCRLWYRLTKTQATVRIGAVACCGR